MPENEKGMFDTVPVIDVGPAVEGTTAGIRHVAEEIRHVYSSVGFGYIVNHGVSRQLTDAIFAASAAFHALPDAAKRRIEINRFHRGFMPINTSTTRTSSVAAVTKPNQSESFMMMHELPPDDPDMLAGTDLAGPNQWPEELPEFRTTCIEYNDALTRLAQKLVRTISVALGADETFLDRHFIRPTTFLRLLYYPPRPPASPEDLFGSAPHTDYGFITVLLQDDAGGLQVRNTAGEWVEAPPVEGAFVMNSGDILHRWSNGQFISTPHRVINRSGRARFSVPFFFDPDMHAGIEPIPTCVTSDQPARYQPVRYGDYLMAKLNANHDQHRDRGTSTSGM